MLSSRQRAQACRQSAVYGLLGGSFLFIVGRWMLQDSNKPKDGYYIPFYGRTGHWPHFFQSFLPLDWGLSCVFMGLVAYLLITKLVNRSGEERGDPQDLRDWAVFVFWLGVTAFTGLGLIGGVIGAGLFGWVLAIVMALEMGLLGVGLVCVLFLVMGLMYGIAFGARVVALRLWPHVKHNWFVRMLQKVGDYFAAADVPNNNT